MATVEALEPPTPRLGRPPLDGSVGPTEWCRQQILDGNSISDREVRAQYKTKGWGQATYAAGFLRDRGYRIAREQRPTAKGQRVSYYRLAADGEPEWVPTQKRLGGNGTQKPYKRSPRKVAPSLARAVAADEPQGVSLVVEALDEVRKARRLVAAATNGHGPDVPPWPMPDTTLVVRWVHLEATDNGVGVIVGLADGEHVWAMAVQGVTPL